ncbi:MAG: hypothetical protein JWR75_228 [Devosia sp.]|nr:hypothetical protein [Devosia sp.]
MRTSLIALTFGLFTTGVFAVEVPLTALYGTEGGCALELGMASTASPEETIGFNTKEIRFEGGVCPFTSVKDVTTEAGAPGFEVGISCASGHDEELRSTLLLSEAADKTSLTAKLIKGTGPEGEFPACVAAPTTTK